LVWGSSPEGKLGLGHPAMDQRHPKLLTFLQDEGVVVTQVAVGARHVCALDKLGEVWTWGFIGEGMASGLDLHGEKPGMCNTM
jgi:alpha-tubulin suppressor-like RCC1 family protein